MKNFDVLPEGYREIFRLDLQKDRKTALLVNGLALLIAVPMVVMGILFVPVSEFFDFSGWLIAYLIKLAVLALGLILYMILHEAVHGIFMKHFVNTKVHYGFTGLYAYAGSTAYFNKKSYITIALAPVIVWSVALLVINCAVSISWFWCIYIIQVCNISGAAGDVYVTYKFLKMPEDILINDTGVAMTVYSCKQ